MDGKRRSPWVGRVVLGIVVGAAAGLGISAFLFSRWSELRTVAPEEAARVFADTLAQAGGGPPYLEISESGRVSVRRELERVDPVPLKALNVLAWEPAGGRLLEIAFPFWFVRAKMTETINLGTLTSALSRDWRNLGLRVSEKDLGRRGPGLVLDHSRPDGARIVVWSE